MNEQPEQPTTTDDQVAIRIQIGPPDLNRNLHADADLASGEIRAMIRDLGEQLNYLQRVRNTPGYVNAHVFDPVPECPYVWHGDPHRRIADWVEYTFGIDVLLDKRERVRRFMEEALELAQACGLTAADCHKLVDYVADKVPGDVQREAADAQITLYALCHAHSVDLEFALHEQLQTLPGRIAKVREKHVLKPLICQTYYNLIPLFKQKV